MYEKPGITGLTVRAHDSKINPIDYRHWRALRARWGRRFMKRFDPKNKYLGWGITAFGVIACCILFYICG